MIYYPLRPIPLLYHHTYPTLRDSSLEARHAHYLAPPWPMSSLESHQRILTLSDARSDNCYTYRHLASPTPCCRVPNPGAARSHHGNLSHHLPLLTLRGGEWAPSLAATHFRLHPPFHSRLLLPQSFWRAAAARTPSRSLRAAAYLAGTTKRPPWPLVSSNLRCAPIRAAPSHRGVAQTRPQGSGPWSRRSRTNWVRCALLRYHEKRPDESQL